MEIIMSINHMTITKVPCSSDRIYDAADLHTILLLIWKKVLMRFSPLLAKLYQVRTLETYYFYQCLSLWMMLKSLLNEWTNLTISPNCNKYKNLINRRPISIVFLKSILLS